ncbi:hypothetical protein GCM10010492_67660 [Saccharothrix mutabilis subsp. mutabilis]|uniref:Uncharacterized protein n=1 Tax=Saccharothrix mutabilis subsp. mutabilis TaxID=66855 RepID=A0ABN0UPC9_9PSEU
MSEFTGLSCYTANLLAYLAAVDDTALDRFAESVRLAVRLDGPAFSHHRTPLDVLPDGSVLRYASGGEETVGALRAEIALHGRVIVVADNARLPWSPSFGTGATAPHWVLVDGCAGDEWHVVDHFAGLLPTGEQRPFEGVLSTSALTHAMDGPERLSPMQVRRNALAFGHPVEAPGGGRTWLRRERGVASGPRFDSRTWVRQFVGVGEALPFLAEWFRRDPVGASVVLDDLWTASGHHVFRYRRVGDDGAADAWRQLPGALRFAVDSARRGRPRDSLVDLTFRNLLHIESGQDAVLPSRGRTAR